VRTLDNGTANIQDDFQADAVSNMTDDTSNGTFLAEELKVPTHFVHHRTLGTPEEFGENSSSFNADDDSPSKKKRVVATPGETMDSGVENPIAMAVSSSNDGDSGVKVFVHGAVEVRGTHNDV